MTNIKYLKENNLYEAHKQFMRMAEGYLRQDNIEEAGEEEDQNAVAREQDPSMDDGSDIGGAEQGADPNAMGEIPMDGSDPNADPNAMDDTNQNAIGEMPIDGGMEEPMVDDTMEEQPEEDDTDVLDIDDLTDAQEKLNDKQNTVGRHVDKIDDKLQQLSHVLDKIEQMIDNNNSEIEDLRGEFKKRNPTQTEKLNLRSLDSYPYNVKPTDFWKQKGMNSNYEPYSDNQEPTTKEYEITNNDIDNLDNGQIANSFSTDEDELENLKQDINKIFGLA